MKQNNTRSFEPNFVFSNFRPDSASLSPSSVSLTWPYKSRSRSLRQNCGWENSPEDREWKGLRIERCDWSLNFVSRWNPSFIFGANCFRKFPSTIFFRISFVSSFLAVPLSIRKRGGGCGKMMQLFSAFVENSWTFEFTVWDSKTFSTLGMGNAKLPWSCDVATGKTLFEG